MTKNQLDVSYFHGRIARRLGVVEVAQLGFGQPRQLLGDEGRKLLAVDLHRRLGLKRGRDLVVESGRGKPPPARRLGEQQQLEKLCPDLRRVPSRPGEHALDLLLLEPRFAHDPGIVLDAGVDRFPRLGQGPAPGLPPALGLELRPRPTL